MLLQTATEVDCLLTGLCGGAPPRVGPPSGLIYLALGMIGFGLWGLVREWRRRRAGPGPGVAGRGTGQAAD